MYQSPGFRLADTPESNVWVSAIIAYSATSKKEAALHNSIDGRMSSPLLPAE